MSQRESVFNAVSAVITVTDNKVVLTSDQRKECHKIIAADLHANRTSLLSDKAQVKYTTEEDLYKKYASGLLNNWLRKDTRLNGGDKYVIQNPGSRAGAGDDQIREMNKLMKQFQTDPEKFEKNIKTLQAAIDTRKKEIDVAKAKTVKIDLSVLPEELIATLGMTESEEEIA